MRWRHVLALGAVGLLLVALVVALERRSGKPMPNYLADDQVVTLARFGNGGHVFSFDPTTGEIKWWGGPQFLGFTGVPAKTFEILNAQFINGGSLVGLAVARDRSRVYILTDQGDFFIFDATLTYLDTVDITGFVSGSFAQFESLAALPNGDVLALVIANDPTVNEAQLVRLSSVGAHVTTHHNLDPNPIATGIRQRMTLAVSADGKRAAYIESTSSGQGYAVAYAAPPGLPRTDPDDDASGRGDTAYVYDLENGVPLDAVSISAAADRHGIALGPGYRLLTGATQSIVSCDTVAAVCPVADVNFGPGLAQRFAPDGTLEATYNVDPDCVWFELTDEALTRNLAGVLDPTQSWRMFGRSIIDQNVFDFGVSGTYITLAFLGDVSYADAWIWLGAVTPGTLNLSWGQGPTIGEITVPYDRFTPINWEITYNATAHTIALTINGSLIGTESIDLSALTFSALEHRLGTDSYSASQPRIGISHVKLYQGATLIGDSPLERIADLTDSEAAPDWTPEGDLETWDDRAGSEASPIGMTSKATQFAYVKYVRDFGDSRLMFALRETLTGATRRIFFAEWEPWEDPNFYPIVRQIVPLITERQAGAMDKKGCCDPRKDQRFTTPHVGNEPRLLDMVYGLTRVCSGDGDFLDGADPVPAELWD